MSIAAVPSKLHPEAIKQIARNATVGTESTTTMRWQKLTPAEARRFLNEGAMIAIGTSGHWMTAVRGRAPRILVGLVLIAAAIGCRVVDHFGRRCVIQVQRLLDAEAALHTAPRGSERKNQPWSRCDRAGGEY
jgi:hypothetical protein